MPWASNGNSGCRTLRRTAERDAVAGLDAARTVALMIDHLPTKLRGQREKRLSCPQCSTLLFVVVVVHIHAKWSACFCYHYYCYSYPYDYYSYYYSFRSHFSTTRDLVQVSRCVSAPVRPALSKRWRAVHPKLLHERRPPHTLLHDSGQPCTKNEREPV